MNSLLTNLLSAIILVAFSVGVFETYQSIEIKNEASNISQAVATWASDIENMYSNQGNYVGLTNQVLVNANEIPEGFQNPQSTTTILGPASTTWTVLTDSSSSGYFDIEGLNTNSSICAEAVPTLRSNALVSVDVCGQVVPYSDTAWTTDINAGCNKCSSSGTVTWTFH